jgi:hypothetical protein
MWGKDFICVRIDGCECIVEVCIDAFGNLLWPKRVAGSVRCPALIIPYDPGKAVPIIA